MTLDHSEPDDLAQTLADLPLVTQDSAARLTEKQELLYRDHRWKLARWALTIGKPRRKPKATPRKP
jgi:hypothetical protein